MSDSKAELVEEECSLCLGTLPPFWDLGRRESFVCCGKSVCSDCMNKQREFIERALADGSYGKGEKQLNEHCPFCRALNPKGDTGKILKDAFDEFEKGQLPLNMYGDLGKRYVCGEGVGRNLERGMEILKLGANEGDPSCQWSLGFRYEEGTYGLPKSNAEAKRWYLRAAEQGHAIAEARLAHLFREEGNDVEYVRHMRGSAAKGYHIACYNLGRAHYNGESGLERSTEEAIHAVMPAAERGNASCMGLLGLAMCCPDPALMAPNDPNFTKGVHWLRRATEKGNEDAISHLKAVEKGASSTCFGCDKKATSSGKAFLRCSRCRAAWYCSKDCQVQHWKAAGGHKQCCIKWK